MKNNKEEIIKRIKSIPIFDTLGMEIIELGDGFCETKVPRKMIFDGIFNSFHGGILIAIADCAACWAILTKSGINAKMATTDMNIRFLAPCLTDVTAKAKIIKFGKTMCPVMVELFDNSNKLIAISQVNFILLNEK